MKACSWTSASRRGTRAKALDPATPQLDEARLDTVRRGGDVVFLHSFAAGPHSQATAKALRGEDRAKFRTGCDPPSINVLSTLEVGDLTRLREERQELNAGNVPQ